MELDSQDTKQAYIRLLIDTLQKKLEVLKKLAEFTGEQEALMNSESFSEDGFLQTITEKDGQLALLNNLDSGFEQIYEAVREELTRNKYQYMQEITTLQELITAITDLSVKLQAMEARNKSKLEGILAEKRKDIKKARVSRNTVAQYYKSMNQQTSNQAFFYDKKK